MDVISCRWSTVIHILVIAAVAIGSHLAVIVERAIGEKIMAPRTGPIETTFKQEILQLMKTFDPAYAEWMVAVFYEVEKIEIATAIISHFLIAPLFTQK